MKNIVITGISRGIGAALVKQLSKNNQVLGFTSSKNSAFDNLTNVQICELNLDDTNIQEKASKLINEHFSHVDILINNAGLLINKPAEEFTREEIEKIYRVNVFGAIEMCQASLKFMKPGAHVVNIGSMGGFQGSAKFPGLSIYSSSKAAIANYSECLAEELKSKNIQVNCLALGAVQTEMLSEAFPGYQASMNAETMAEFIADFALNGNKHFNGKILPVSISTP